MYGQWHHQLCKLGGPILKLVIHKLTNNFSDVKISASRARAAQSGIFIFASPTYNLTVCNSARQYFHTQHTIYILAICNF